MKPPPNLPPAARRATPAWALALALLATAPVSGAPPERSPADDVRVVSADAEPCLSVRQRPSRRARIVDCLERGSRVTVTGKRGGWRRVATAGGVAGWVDGDLLVAAEMPPPSAPIEPPAEAAASASLEPEVPAATPPPAAQKAPAEPPPTAPAEATAEPPAIAPAEAIAEPRVTAPTEAIAEPPAPAPAGSSAARKAPVRIVVVGDSEGERAASVEVPAPERPAPARAERDQLAERARIAEERATALEAELAAARDARESGGADESELAARVEELTRERDDLAGKLARAEARLLYVLSDLEQTRAELMRLKGIPAQLVRPESEPEPAAPNLEPAPEPTEAVEPEAPAPPVTPPFMSVDAVVGTVRAWAQAWADQRADDYLAFYSSSFTPPEGESREAWAARRRERIRAPRSIVITLDRINPIVGGDRASVTFRQTYVSETFSDTVTKTLVLERTSGANWQIVEERVD